jgi:demethylmenaquinone methyltransferase/2-methoxy-6-polyprenyl-1,4-benzoquinol methylase
LANFCGHFGTVPNGVVSIQVPKDSKVTSSEFVRSLFDRIASNYDTLNDVLSFGVHRTWKKRLVREMIARNATQKVLDVATGTGDLALLFAQLGSQVTGVDFSSNMLAIAETRSAKSRLATNGSILWKTADALALPFEDGSFNGVSCAFGVRNFSDPSRGVHELWRCVAPGGTLAILEFGGWDRLWPLRMLIRVGARVFRGEREAYDYLIRSSTTFPAGGPFVDRYLATLPNQKVARAFPLNFGIVHLYLVDKR